MLSYLMIKQSGSNKSIKIKDVEPSKPYIAIKNSGDLGYIPLTTETSGTGYKIKVGSSYYKIADSKTTTTTTMSYGFYDSYIATRTYKPRSSNYSTTTSFFLGQYAGFHQSITISVSRTATKSGSSTSWTISVSVIPNSNNGKLGVRISPPEEYYTNRLDLYSKANNTTIGGGFNERWDYFVDVGDQISQLQTIVDFSLLGANRTTSTTKNPAHEFHTTFTHSSQASQSISTVFEGSSTGSGARPRYLQFEYKVLYTGNSITSISGYCSNSITELGNYASFNPRTSEIDYSDNAETYISPRYISISGFTGLTKQELMYKTLCSTMGMDLTRTGTSSVRYIFNSLGSQVVSGFSNSSQSTSNTNVHVSEYTTMEVETTINIT